MATLIPREGINEVFVMNQHNRHLSSSASVWTGSAITSSVALLQALLENGSGADEWIRHQQLTFSSSPSISSDVAFCFVSLVCGVCLVIRHPQTEVEDVCSSLRMESQGCHLIPLSCLVLRPTSIAVSALSFLLLLLPTGPFS